MIVMKKEFIEVLKNIVKGKKVHGIKRKVGEYLFRKLIRQYIENGEKEVYYVEMIGDMDTPNHRIKKMNDINELPLTEKGYAKLHIVVKKKPIEIYQLDNSKFVVVV